MKDFAVAIIYGAALFVSIKYAWRWYNGELSTPAIMEWFGRGFFCLGRDSGNINCVFDYSFNYGVCQMTTFKEAQIIIGIDPDLKSRELPF